jgi:hypothetical protein
VHMSVPIYNRGLYDDRYARDDIEGDVAYKYVLLDARPCDTRKATRYLNESGFVSHSFHLFNILARLWRAST